MSEPTNEVVTGASRARSGQRRGEPGIPPDQARGQMMSVVPPLPCPSVEQNYEMLAVRIAHLEAAVASRTTIGQAEGILMERHRLTPEQAFQRLRTTSQHLNQKLREVAAELVATGQERGPGKTPSKGPPPTDTAFDDSAFDETASPADADALLRPEAGPRSPVRAGTKS